MSILKKNMYKKTTKKSWVCRYIQAIKETLAFKCKITFHYIFALFGINRKEIERGL